MRKISIVASGLIIAGAAACGHAAPTTSADAAVSDCGTGPVSSALVRTASYEFTASAGPLEATYTKAQVDAQHPSIGEMMLGGNMIDVPGMPMNGSNSPGMPDRGSGGANMPVPTGTDLISYRHVEVHICNRTSGKVIQHATPSLSLIDRSAHDTSQHMSVAVMQGVHTGIGDMHYGNNAKMVKGHRYTLAVSMTGEHAHFDFDVSR